MGQWWYILAKKLIVTPHVLKSEARLKINGLICLAEDINRHHNIRAAGWLSLAAFRKIYSENQERKSRAER